MSTPSVKGPGGVYMTPEQASKAWAMHVPTECVQGGIPTAARLLAASMAVIHNSTVLTLEYSGGWVVLLNNMASVPLAVRSEPVPPAPKHPPVPNSQAMGAWQATTAAPLPQPAAPSAGPAPASSPTAPHSTGGNMTDATAAGSTPAATAPAAPSVITQIETDLTNVMAVLKDIEANNPVQAITAAFTFLTALAHQIGINIKL